MARKQTYNSGGKKAAHITPELVAKQTDEAKAHIARVKKQKQDRWDATQARLAEQAKAREAAEAKADE